MKSTAYKNNLGRLASMWGLWILWNYKLQASVSLEKNGCFSGWTLWHCAPQLVPVPPGAIPRSLGVFQSISCQPTPFPSSALTMIKILSNAFMARIQLFTTRNQLFFLFAWTKNTWRWLSFSLICGCTRRHMSIYDFPVHFLTSEMRISLFFFLFTDWAVRVMCLFLCRRTLAVRPFHSTIFWLLAQTKKTREGLGVCFNLNNLYGTRDILKLKNCKIFKIEGERNFLGKISTFQRKLLG